MFYGQTLCYVVSSLFVIFSQVSSATLLLWQTIRWERKANIHSECVAREESSEQLMNDYYECWPTHTHIATVYSYCFGPPKMRQHFFFTDSSSIFTSLG